MVIAKKQSDLENYRFNCSYFDSARSGFKAILKSINCRGKKILLPAYIGISIREGSGVFDPIRSVKTPYEFYRMDKTLSIDVKDLKDLIRGNKGQILLLIHYFGFKDKNLAKIKTFAKKNGLIVVEDFAHAFFTFFKDPQIDFDYAFFSLHKMFPMSSGGMVISKDRTIKGGGDVYGAFQYDLKAISEKRIKNFMFLLKQIKKYEHSHGITVLRTQLKGAVPQTLPILLKSTGLRDQLYFELNARGYGVVSLYHELIEQIDAGFNAEQELSSRILNLPVHQDAEPQELSKMVTELLKLVRTYKDK